MPTTTNFSKELATWQLENGSKPGKLFLKYPAPLELVNTVYSVAPPEIRLYNPHPENRNSLPIRDTHTFRHEVRDAVLRLLDLDPDDWFTHEMPEGYNCTDEELDFINKYHCNRSKQIRLRKDDPVASAPQRRILKFGTSNLLAAETIYSNSGKYVWAVIARKKVSHGNVSYHSLYYSTSYDSLETLAHGSTTIFRGFRKIETSMDDCQFTENGMSFCFETRRMNIEELMRDSVVSRLLHCQLFGERNSPKSLPKRIKVTEISTVTQELMRLL